MGRIIKEGNLVNFTSAIAATIHSLKVYFEPKQTGSGNPSPTNVRPINGWTEVAATRTGKSIMPFVHTSKTITNYYNGFSDWSIFWLVPDKNAKYTYSVYIENNDSNRNAHAKVWYHDGTNYVDGTASNGTEVAPKSSGWSTITVNMANKPNTLQLGFGLEGSNMTANNPMVEYGDTSSLYEPYSSSSVTIDWQSTAGTLYGGYVDLISGELVQTHGCVFNSNKASLYSDEKGSFWYSTADELNTPRIKGLNAGLLTNRFINDNNVSYASADNRIVWYANNIIRWKEQMNLSRNDYLTYLANNPIQMVYEFDTPITYQLTSSQLSTFIGQNNIWSNATKVEIEYEVPESSTLQLIRRKIIQSAPYIATTAAAYIASFSTDMIAPLKECKVNFLPFQDGNGDPSPNNVRKIIGTQGGTVLTLGEEINIEPIDFEPIELDGGTLRYLGNGTFYLDGTLNSNAKILIPISPFNISLNDNYCVTMEASSTNILQIYAIAFRTNSSRIVSITKTPPSNSCFDKDYSYWTSNLEALCEILNLGISANSSNVTIKIHLFRNTNSQFENTFTWKNSLGTIYGGYVDLIKGELVQTHKKVVLNDSTKWGYSAMSGKWFCRFYQVQMSDRQAENKYTLTCSIATADDSNIHYIQWNKSSGYYPVLCWDTELTTPTPVEDIQTLSANNSIEICYPLATPITYQLTPQQLKTLRGANNIWSNTNGNIELKYFTH